MNINILNSLVLLHSNALYTEELHEKVLPLYEKHKIEPDVFTYQHLISHYVNINENGLVFDTYNRMVALNIAPNKVTMSNLLLASMKSKDIDRIIHALELYQGTKHLPNDKYLRKLSNIRDPPDRLYIALKSFPKQFGKIRQNYRTFTPPVARPKVKKHVQKRLKGNRRTRLRGF